MQSLTISGVEGKSSQTYLKKSPVSPFPLQGLSAPVTLSYIQCPGNTRLIGVLCIHCSLGSEDSYSSFKIQLRGHFPHETTMPAPLPLLQHEIFLSGLGFALHKPCLICLCASASSAGQLLSKWLLTERVGDFLIMEDFLAKGNSV